MGTVLKAATLVELEPASVEVGDLRIDRDRIVERAASIEPQPDDEVIDLAGRLVLPGFVSAHHRFIGTALRGAPRAEAGYPGQQACINRLEDALTPDDVEALCAMGALEALRAGTTTVFAVHASPQAVTGSLNRVAHGLSGAGLRAVLAYEISDRNDPDVRDEAFGENYTYMKLARGRYRGALAVGHLASLSADALSSLSSAARASTGNLLLGTLAPDSDEEKASARDFGATALERLFQADLVGPQSVFSHNVHLSWPELSSVIARGSWMVHTPRANMASQTGLATPAKFGVRAALGTDVMPLDVLAEAQAAALRTLDSGLPIDVLRFLANGQRLATEAFGFPVGPLQPGAAADLVVLDYLPPTPLTAATLGAHLVWGLASRDVESVMVDGLWRLWKRKPLAVDPLAIARASLSASEALWRRAGLL